MQHDHSCYSVNTSEMDVGCKPHELMVITCCAGVLPVEARCWLSEPGSSHPENKTHERTDVIFKCHKALEIDSKCQRDCFVLRRLFTDRMKFMTYLSTGRDWECRSSDIIILLLVLLYCKVCVWLISGSQWDVWWEKQCDMSRCHGIRCIFGTGFQK